MAHWQLDCFVVESANSVQLFVVCSDGGRSFPAYRLASLGVVIFVAPESVCLYKSGVRDHLCCIVLLSTKFKPDNCPRDSDF